MYIILYNYIVYYYFSIHTSTSPWQCHMRRDRFTVCTSSTTRYWRSRGQAIRLRQYWTEWRPVPGSQFYRDRRTKCSGENHFRFINFDTAAVCPVVKIIYKHAFCIIVVLCSSCCVDVCMKRVSATVSYNYMFNWESQKNQYADTDLSMMMRSSATVRGWS